MSRGIQTNTEQAASASVAAIIDNQQPGGDVCYMLYCCLYCSCFLHCSCSCCSCCLWCTVVIAITLYCCICFFHVVVLVLVVTIVVSGEPSSSSSLSSSVVHRHLLASILPFLLLSQCIVVSGCFALFCVVLCCCCPCPCGCCVRIYLFFVPFHQFFFRHYVHCFP